MEKNPSKFKNSNKLRNYYMTMLKLIRTYLVRCPQNFTCKKRRQITKSKNKYLNKHANKHLCLHTQYKILAIKMPVTTGKWINVQTSTASELNLINIPMWINNIYNCFLYFQANACFIWGNISPLCKCISQMPAINLQNIMQTVMHIYMLAILAAG